MCACRRDNMIKHLEKHKLVKDSQHGFVRNRSCLTNLLIFMKETEEVTNYIDRGYPVLGFSKLRLLIKSHTDDC